MEIHDRCDYSVITDTCVWRLLYTDTHGKQWITKFVRNNHAEIKHPNIGVVTYELGADSHGLADGYEYFAKADATKTWQLLVQNWCATPITYRDLQTLELKHYGIAP